MQHFVSMNTLVENQEINNTPQSTPFFSEQELMLYKEQVDSFVLLYIQDMLSLTEKFTEEFKKKLPQVHSDCESPNDEWKSFGSMWLREDIDLLKAIKLLCQNGMGIQALSLCRTILEIYFTLEWIFEEGKLDVRLELLKTKSIETSLKNINQHSNKYGEVELSNNNKTEIENSLKRRMGYLQTKFPSDFPNEKTIKKELDKIKSYPKIDNNNQSELYKKNKEFHAYLSSEVHAKDFTKRLSYLTNRLSTDDDFVNFFTEKLTLVDALICVCHTIVLLARKVGIEQRGFEAEIIKLHNQREAITLARP
jgi:hypothetical protein